MKLFITGATGMVGRRLMLDRLERGDQVVALTRDAPRAVKLFAADANRNITVVQGNPAAPGSWQGAVAGCQAVIHLAGAGIADRRWNAAYKRLLRDSRIDSSHQIVAAIGQAPAAKRPSVLINASAVGYYGAGGDRELDESTPTGRDFLAQLVVDWETQALRAEALGVRVALMRSGLILDSQGGALRRMVVPFRFFAGGPIGSGRQYVPWIHWRDLVGLVDLALERAEARGPINAVAPQAVTNRQFSRALGRALGRPSWLPVPSFVLRLALGEVARYAAMSQRVVPRRAAELGYPFLYPRVQEALESLLRASRSGPDTDKRPREPAIKITAAGDGQSSRPAVPIKLLAVSVDGALLRSDGTLSQGVIQACRAAVRAGCVVVPATARPPRGVRAVMAALDVPGPAITYNGALIWNPQEDRPLHHEPLDAETARSLIADARGLVPELLVGIAIMDHWYTDRIDERLAGVEGRAMDPDCVGPLEEFLKSPVTKLNLFAESRLLEPVLGMVRERYWQPRKVAVYLDDPRLIQVAAPLADKAIALQRIARRMDVSREQVMAIGSGANDAGMMEWAGFGVAVANAHPSVKRLAKAVTPGCDEQGVAKAVHRFVLARG